MLKIYNTDIETNKIEEIEFEDDSSQKIDGVFIAQGTAGCLEFAKKLKKYNYIFISSFLQINLYFVL